MSRSCNSVQEGAFDHLEPPKQRSSSFSEIVDGHPPPRYPKIIDRRYSAAVSQADSSMKIESLMNSGEQVSHQAGKKLNMVGILKQAKEVV